MAVAKTFTAREQRIKNICETLARSKFLKRCQIFCPPPPTNISVNNKLSNLICQLSVLTFHEIVQDAEKLCHRVQCHKTFLMAHSRPLFHYFKQTLIFLQQINLKKCPSKHSAGNKTHYLLNTSLIA